jgi:ABC-type uncharacterized transport system substrate-binding protein
LRFARLSPRSRFVGYLFSEGVCDEGGLMSNGADFDDQFRKAAHYAAKILKGAKPAELPSTDFRVPIIQLCNLAKADA